MLLREIADKQNQPAGFTDFAPAACDNPITLGAPPAIPRVEEAALIESLRNGDDAAFEQIVRQFGGRLLATARRYLRSEDDARDALQEAFLCAFRSIGNFKRHAQLSTWLHRIVINTSLMHLRARKRRPETEEAQINQLLSQFDPMGNWIGEWTAAMPADISLEISESRAMVRRCIGRLPDSYRLILVMRDIDELSTEEAAILLGLTSNAIKVRLHRARLALRVLIEREQAL